MGRCLFGRRKSSSPSYLADNQAAMPSRVPYPPDLSAQFAWDAQSAYGDGSMTASATDTNTETLEWPFYSRPTIQCPAPSVYQTFLDIPRTALDTPSLDGSTRDSSWDCPSADCTTLNTPTSICGYNFDVQDTDSLDIMLAASPQARIQYANDLSASQPAHVYSQYLTNDKDYLKRRRSESDTASADLLVPGKISRTSNPGQTSPDPDSEYPDGCSIATPNVDESDGEGGPNSEPYAQLIYRALKSAPNHSMVLKEIYEWFEKNTDKAKIVPGTTSSKGWQNSIRHNLSMNGARKPISFCMDARANDDLGF